MACQQQLMPLWCRASGCARLAATVGHTGQRTVAAAGSSTAGADMHVHQLQLSALSCDRALPCSTPLLMLVCLHLSHLVLLLPCCMQWWRCWQPRGQFCRWRARGLCAGVQHAGQPALQHTVHRQLGGRSAGSRPACAVWRAAGECRQCACSACRPTPRLCRPVSGGPRPVVAEAGCLSQAQTGCASGRLTSCAIVPAPRAACLLFHLQGFQQLKVLRSGRQVSCFVEFETVESASQCHTTQQVRRRSTRGWTAGQPAQRPQQGHAVLLPGVAGPPCLQSLTSSCRLGVLAPCFSSADKAVAVSTCCVCVSLSLVPAMWCCAGCGAGQQRPGPHPHPVQQKPVWQEARRVWAAD